MKSALDQDSIRRLEKNPLRILDSKNPDMREIIAEAPLMIDYLDPESAEHFSRLKELLDAAGVAYTLNPRLVRGLDYYSRTVFEWVTDALGSQGAVCSGGRYDGLVDKLGGRETPAIGWAMGIERLVALYEVCGGKQANDDADVYIVAVGAAAELQAIAVGERLRTALSGLRVELNLGGGSFKSQMKRADKSGATCALLLGETEVAEGRIGVKPLRSDAEQISVTNEQLIESLRSLL